MHPASRYLTVCAVVLVATLVVAEPLDRRIVNDKNAASGLDNHVMPVTSQRLDKRIINGQDAQHGSHPYIAELRVGGEHYCGGALIHESWVLTAAHCVDIFLKYKWVLKVVLGEHHLEEESCTEHEIDVKNIIVHPDWTYRETGRAHHDIALIELSTNASLSDTIKIATLSKNDSAFVNTECMVAGWGGLSMPNGPIPDILQEINITVISNSECRERHRASGLGGRLTDDQVCILDQTPQPSQGSICNGDSGGPLICGGDDNLLVGLASYVYPGCVTHVPQVYTRVSAYIDFIEREAGIHV